ncbi:MAG: aldo/keto reductase [Flavobacteriales bacterium]|nr:aldo/keto reductase [Flavobacteriales bacterium]MBK6755162.1 aldo/keto reductase [Flavobacteriales bacterium]MBK7084375.1 aldo/keto reductase [Flavobacteriales bacterium]MBK7267998.1 aldo/keto reductase [Flavobacteriales bacterium]MBK7751342.1 aldo/keto reductase [Flavobacteriales bacterium]
MHYRRLGNSGLQVSELSLGSWLTFGKQITDAMAEKLMRIAYEGGINFFDNAEIYARGESERVMGKILKKVKWPRDTWIVSSKVFFGSGGKLPTQTGLHRKHVVEACNDALKRLQVDYLDLYFCHRPDKNTPIEETVWTMHQLILSGKILYWGTSEWSAQEIMEAHMVAKQHHLIGPVMEQPQYNMFHRAKVEVEYEQIYKTVGLGTTIWSPLASGILSGKHTLDGAKSSRLRMAGLDWLRERELTTERLKKVEQLKGIARKLDLSMPLLALAWCLKNPHVSTVILGASKEAQLKENLHAVEAKDKLTPEVMARIAKVLDNAPVRPLF